MIEMNLTIISKLGLHARPASVFVKETKEFKSNVKIIKGNKSVNGKSLIGILSLGIINGDEITLMVEGDDEKEALDYLGSLIMSGLGEGV